MVLKELPQALTSALAYCPVDFLSGQRKGRGPLFHSTDVSVASPPPPESGRGGMKIIMRKAVRTPLRASNSQLKEGQGISCLIGY